MALLVSIVLLDIMPAPISVPVPVFCSCSSHIITADNDGSLHLVRDNNSTEKLSTDADVADPWALLVDVDSVLGLQRSLEAKANRLHEAARA